MLPCSRNILLCDAHVSGKDKILNTASDGQSSLEPGYRTSTSIMSLPVSSRLIITLYGRQVHSLILLLGFSNLHHLSMPMLYCQLKCPSKTEGDVSIVFVLKILSFQFFSFFFPVS